MMNVRYDNDQVRYKLYQGSGDKAHGYNWLFFSGGPGADCCYMQGIADLAKLPGNVWLIDLPGNGDNLSDDYTDNFDRWFELFSKVVKQFNNPIIVGHSAGGFFSLLYPEFEDVLKGLVIFNAAPKFWAEEALAYSKQFDLPDYTIEMGQFVQNPTKETFACALKACLPYYFSKENLAKGSQLLLQTPFNFHPALWAQYAGAAGKLDAKWVPQKVPTLIISGKYDCMCPYTLFANDARFQRDNIAIKVIETAGHCPWVDAPDATGDILKDFINEHLPE